ncbi:MAG: hypothetical protein JWM35_2357 [Verrucomicrobia bacterium]|nr:hypothetical protein [Verrucomicrobiota bacterium]
MKRLAVFFLAVGLARAADSNPEMIRIWGNPAMAGVIQQWEAGFARSHAGVKFETHLTGSDTAIAGLDTGRADVALMGRSCSASEIQAFEWIFRYKPMQVEVMTGSLDQPGKSAAPVFFVHRENPLTELSVAQLAAVLRGGSGGVRTWGELGAKGEWASQPINLYLPDTTSNTGKFLQQALLDGSKTMNWEHLTEFNDREKFQNPTHDAGAQAIGALAKDRFGLGVANMAFDSPQVRALALRSTAGGSAIAPTRASLASRDYPLARAAVAVVNQRPDAPLPPRVREFLAYVLNNEGQRAVEPNGYLPLTPANVSEQLRKLK